MSSFNLKTQMKDGDIHAIISAKSNMLVPYDFKGNKIKDVVIQAFPWGQHADWHTTNGDTPPGLYKAGLIYTQVRGRDSNAICNAYGPFCVDLIDLEGQERDNGRDGVSIHGGGSGLPDPWADYQALTYTHGCVRVHNKDLVDKLVPLIQKTQKAGRTFYVTVVR